MPIEFDNMPGLGQGEDPTYKQALARRAVGEYQRFRHTREVVTSTWGALWHAWQELTDIKVEVPQPDLTANEIQQLEQRGRMLIYLPKELSEPGALSSLQALLPKQTQPCYWAGQTAAIHIDNIIPAQYGWLSVENADRISERKAYAPDSGEKTPEGEKRRKGIEDGTLVGQTVNTYVLGSIFHGLTTGRFFDEEWTGVPSGEALKPSILPGSRIVDLIKPGKPRVPYAVAHMGKPTGMSWGKITTLYDFVIWSQGGEIDYDAVRTVEVNPKAPHSSRRPNG